MVALHVGMTVAEGQITGFISETRWRHGRSYPTTWVVVERPDGTRITLLPSQVTALEESVRAA